MSWNLGRADLWSYLEDLDADVALLQEVAHPAAESALEVLPDCAGPRFTAGWHRRPWRTAIARLSDRVRLDPRTTLTVETASSDEHPCVSRDGTIAAADVTVDEVPKFTVVSVYAVWERTPQGVLYADASAHRLLSDLSALMGTRRHRLIVAGDWSILRRYGEYGDAFYKARYASVLDRAEASDCDSSDPSSRMDDRPSRGQPSCPARGPGGAGATGIVRT